MIISCTSCQTQFKVADDRLVPGGKSVRCSKCGHVWRVMPDGQPGAEVEPPPDPVPAEPPAAVPIQTEAPAPADISPPEPPAPVLSARDPVDEGDGGQDTGKPEPVTVEAAGASGLTTAQRAKLTAARGKKPRGRFLVKLLVVFVGIAALLLLVQKLLPALGPDIPNAPTDVGEVDAKPVPTDPAAKPKKK